MNAYIDKTNEFRDSLKGQSNIIMHYKDINTRKNDYGIDEKDLLAILFRPILSYSNHMLYDLIHAKKLFFMKMDLKFEISSPKNIGKDTLHVKFEQKLTNLQC